MAAILSWPQCVNQMWVASQSQLDASHKCHNTLVPCRTMHHFVTDMYTFLLQNAALWDMGLVHCGICATGCTSVAVTMYVISCYRGAYYNGTRPHYLTTFSWNKSSDFKVNCICISFYVILRGINQHWFDNGLVPNGDKPLSKPVMA